MIFSVILVPSDTVTTHFYLLNYFEYMCVGLQHLFVCSLLSIVAAAVVIVVVVIVIIFGDSI